MYSTKEEALSAIFEALVEGDEAPIFDCDPSGHKLDQSCPCSPDRIEKDGKVVFVHREAN